MKDKILYLVIGIIIGAIIATGVFMVIGKNNNAVDRNRGQFNRGFDLNNLPEGFDANNLPTRPGNSQNTVTSTDTI